MKNNQPLLEYSILALVIIACIVFFLHLKNQEINLCQSILGSLSQGKTTVEKFIDWENLNALGVNVGATYTGLANEKEKADYKKAFIQNFAFGFQKSGGKSVLFRHWRIYQRDSGKVIVACDYSGYNKTLLFIISKLGKNKLISLQLK